MTSPFKLFSPLRTEIANSNPNVRQSGWLRFSSILKPKAAASVSQFAEFYLDEPPTNGHHEHYEFRAAYIYERGEVNFGSKHVTRDLAEYNNCAAALPALDHAYEYKATYIRDPMTRVRHVLFLAYRPVKVTREILRNIFDEINADPKEGSPYGLSDLFLEIPELQTAIEGGTKSVRDVLCKNLKSLAQVQKPFDGSPAFGLLSKRSTFVAMQLYPPLTRVVKMQTLCELHPMNMVELCSWFDECRNRKTRPGDIDPLIPLGVPWKHDIAGFPQCTAADVLVVAREVYGRGPVQSNIKQISEKLTVLEILQLAFKHAAEDGHTCFPRRVIPKLYLDGLRDKRNRKNTLKSHSTLIKTALKHVSNPKNETFQDLKIKILWLIKIYHRWVNNTVKIADIHNEFWECNPRADPSSVLVPVRPANVPPTVRPKDANANVHSIFMVYRGDDAMMMKYNARAIGDMVQRFAKLDAVHKISIGSDADVIEAIRKAREGKGTVSLRPEIPGMPWIANPDFLSIYERCDPDQKAAIRKFIRHPFTIVTGMPGTGKTDLVPAARALFPSMFPVAAYGRIAALHTERLARTSRIDQRDGGYTYHRASALVTYRGSSEEAKQLMTAKATVHDEFLQTMKHLYLFNRAFKHHCRMLFLGDILQKSAIGNGSFATSLMRRFAGNPEFHTHLRIPHRFIPRDAPPSAHQTFALTSKPKDPSSPLAMAWNMRVVIDHDLPDDLSATVKGALKGTVDYYQRLLSYGSDIYSDARWVLLSRQKSLLDTLRPVVDKYLANRSGEEPKFFFIAFTNEVCRLVNKIVLHLLYHRDERFDPLQRRTVVFRVGQRVMCLKNRYAEKGMEDADKHLNHVSVQDSDNPGPVPIPSSASAGPGKRSRPGEKKKRERTDDWRGRDCDAVFNGFIKTIAKIVYVDATGQVMQRANSTDYKEIKDTRGLTMMIIFTDETQVLIHHEDGYSLDHLTHAYCGNSSKMQGSEEEVIAYILDKEDGSLSPKQCVDDLHTSGTRGKKRVIFIGGQHTFEDRFHDVDDAYPCLRTLTKLISKKPAIPMDTFAENLTCFD